MFIMFSLLNLFTCSCVPISHLTCTLYHICKPCQFIYIYVCETIRTHRCYALLFWPRALVNDSFFFALRFATHAWYELACGVIVSCVYISVFHSGPSRKATPSQGVCLLVFARSETSILSTYRQKYIMSYLFNLLLFLQLYASGPLLLRFLTKVDVASRGAQRQ